MWRARTAAIVARVTPMTDAELDVATAQTVLREACVDSFNCINVDGGAYACKVGTSSKLPSFLTSLADQAHDTWTMTLRPNVTFSDGSYVSAIHHPPAPATGPARRSPRRRADTS